jgi:hypothetical protein
MYRNKGDPDCGTKQSGTVKNSSAIGLFLFTKKSLNKRDVFADARS